jgi:hypothetical protein
MALSACELAKRDVQFGRTISKTQRRCIENLLTALHARTAYSASNFERDLQAVDTIDHGVVIPFPIKTICRLEWIVWAMDAARQHNESCESEPPCDMCAYYSSDQLPVL